MVINNNNNKNNNYYFYKEEKGKSGWLEGGEESTFKDEDEHVCPFILILLLHYNKLSPKEYVYLH